MQCPSDEVIDDLSDDSIMSISVLVPAGRSGWFRSWRPDNTPKPMDAALSAPEGADSAQPPVLTPVIAESAAVAPGKAQDADSAALYARLLHALQRSFILGLCVLGCLALSIWRVAHPPMPSIIYRGTDGISYPVVPLREPVLSSRYVTHWTQRAVLQAYSIDFKNYRAQFTRARRHFDEVGWQSFRHAFLKSGNFKKLLRAKLISSAQVVSPPVIRNLIRLHGHFTYEIQFPIVVSYENSNDVVPDHLIVTVWVERVPIARHPAGIAIHRMAIS